MGGVVVRCETRSALESFRSKACCAKESTVGISTLHVAEFGAEHTSEFGAEHTPCHFHHDDTYAATARLPTCSNASSLRLLLFSDISFSLGLHIWCLKIFIALCTNIETMFKYYINDENIGISAINNNTMANRSDFQIQHHRSPLVIYIFKIQ